ncbi:MAG: TRAM domain-containing protein [Verrucomicrobiota bacterium]|nr:TRAM domain-containing protein [Verrucomicrobiota bacterium]
MRAVELQIEDVAFGGKGVARYEGKAVFVPFTIEGERVTAHLTREKKKFAEAELEQVIDRSPMRADPPCPYFGRCGGCAYQHIEYAHQLAVKARQVEQALRRIGRLMAVPMRSMIPSPLPYAYRNRITVHAVDGVVGFYRHDAHELIDITRCPIARPEVNEALARLRRRRLRDGHFTLRAHAGPRVFEQTNDGVAAALRELIATFFPERKPLLIDAYCGAGSFAKRLRDNFERVIGIDWDRFAIAEAQAGAAAHEQYIAGDVNDELRTALSPASAAGASVIVDPPATGLDPEIRRTLLASDIGTLVYVSCNPATLARDLGELQTRFSIESVTPLDMFPQTAEIEIAVQLERRPA